MAREYTFEQIEEYLDGQLSEDERKEFEREIEVNSELNDEVVNHRQVRKLNELHTRQQVKEKIKNIHQRVKSERQTLGGFSVMKIAASIALLLVAGALYFYLQNEYSSDTLAENAFEPYPNRYRTMGEETGDNFQLGLKYYDMQQYQKAIETFQGIPESDDHYLPAQFYLGISFLSQNQPAKSIQAFQLAMEDELFSEAAKWYLSLAYIQSGDEEEAKGLLNEIVKTNGYKAENAEKLLKRLNSPVRKLPGVN